MIQEELTEEEILEKTLWELNKWWGHLAVVTKEEAMGCNYPKCTERWNALDVFGKKEVYDEFGGRNAHSHHKVKKGLPSFT